MSDTATLDAPFWSDDFDMDLPKIFPNARTLLGDLAGVEMWTTGRPCPRTGRLNHPAVWNGDHSMLAYFGFKSPRRPPGMVAPGSGDIKCTAWEAFRDAWPHGFLMILEGAPVWDTFELQAEFDTIMWSIRGWGNVHPARVAHARRNVLRSYMAAVRRLGRIVQRYPDAVAAKAVERCNG